MRFKHQLPFGNKAKFMTATNRDVNAILVMPIGATYNDGFLAFV
jgi:hypothetical protein